MSTAIDKARIGLVEITERKGQKITARDVATAHLAIAALDNMQERAMHDSRVYGSVLSDSVERGIQLKAVREMLGQIREILE